MCHTKRICGPENPISQGISTYGPLTFLVGEGLIKKAVDKTSTIRFTVICEMDGTNY